MTTREALRAWVQGIIDRRCGGNASEFARQIGTDSSYVSRMLYPDDKPGAKGIGGKTIKAIMAAFPGESPPSAAGVLIIPDSDAEVPATGIFTKERRASDDLLAVQIGLESLLLAVLQRAPGAAGAFLSDVKAVAKGHRFSTRVGFLGSLVDIAQRVHSEEEAAARVRQRAGSAARTTRGKPD